MLYSTPFLNKPLWEEDEAIIFLMNIEIPMWKAKSEIRSLDFQEKNCTKFNPEKFSRKMALENWLNKQTRLVDSIKNPLAADVSLGKLKQIILKDKPHYHREKFIDWVFDNQICQFIGNKESLRIFDEIRNETDNQAKATRQQAEAVDNGGAGSDAIREPKERELTAWLRTTWIKEGKPGGTAFFTKLKKYEKQKGSPIVEHYSAGKSAGIRWQTNAGTTGTMAKKTVLTKVSIFKNTP